MSQTPSEYLTGVIERITFHAEETGYTVARLQLPKAKELTTVVGNFANIQAGQTLKLGNDLNVVTTQKPYLL